jgi:NAD+ kinase
VSERISEPERIRSAVLLTHTRPEQTRDAVRAAVAEARRAGCTLVADAEELAKHGEAAEGIAPLEELGGERPDLCLVLGGDGSILKALRLYACTGVPVFAINYGTVGFLAAVDNDQLDEGLRRAFAGDFKVLRLPALTVDVNGDAKAFNDITFTRRADARVAELSFAVGGQEVGHVRCDGLVAATPAGSTGYNLANQGPILAWGVEGYVVSFIAPHTLTARPLVVAPGDVLQVRNAAGRDPVDVLIDGERMGELASGAETRVRFRDDMAQLAQLPQVNFYQRIYEKFGHLGR